MLAYIGERSPRFQNRCFLFSRFNFPSNPSSESVSTCQSLLKKNLYRRIEYENILAGLHFSLHCDWKLGRKVHRNSCMKYPYYTIPTYSFPTSSWIATSFAPQKKLTKPGLRFVQFVSSLLFDMRSKTGDADILKGWDQK